MELSVLQRTIVLAGVALVAALAAVVVAGQEAEEAGDDAAARMVTVPETGWYTALAGSRGVSHPVLPCGAKVFISFQGTDVLTEVIDQRMKRQGRQFELTETLAQQLGLEGTQQIRWRFAQR